MYLIQLYVFAGQPPSIEVIVRQLQLNSGLEVVLEGDGAPSTLHDTEYYRARIGFACSKERLNIRIEGKSSQVDISGNVANPQLARRLELVLTALGGFSTHPDLFDQLARIKATNLAYSQPISAQQLQTSERRTSRQLIVIMPIMILIGIILSPVWLTLITWQLFRGHKNPPFGDQGPTFTKK